MKAVISLIATACLAAEAPPSHLANIRQLTSGGQNAEAYWSPDGQRLIFQTTRPPYGCDQIFIMNADGSDQQRVMPIPLTEYVPTWARSTHNGNGND